MAPPARRLSRRAAVVLVPMMAWAGCAQPHKPESVSSAASTGARAGSLPEPSVAAPPVVSAPPSAPMPPVASVDPASPGADPLAFLERVRVKAAALKQYRVTFIRRERLGIVPSLRPQERIAAAFRADPFSVHFRWLDQESEYNQALFVRGQNGDKVALLPRNGLLGMKPVVANYNPQDAVTFQKARNPITDFGLARMMERTLKRIADANGAASIQYVGVTPLGVEKRPTHKFELRFPPTDPFPNKLMELLIDQRTELPVGVWLRLPSGKLDAMYAYEDLDAQVTLSGDDFAIRPVDDGQQPARVDAAPQRAPTEPETTVSSN